MKKFEVGKRYTDGAMTFEITGRTEKQLNSWKYSMLVDLTKERVKRRRLKY